jgi:hypothetical protein
MMVTITPGALPIPNSMTTGTRYTNAGVVCMASSSGRRMFCARSLLARKIPSGKPIARQNTSEVSTSDKVIIASGQTPSVDRTSSATTVPMASARLVNCQTSRPMMAIISSEGTASSRWLAPFKVASIGVRTAWKKGRKCSTTQPRPSLIQDCSGSEPSKIRVRSKPPACCGAAAGVAASSQEVSPGGVGSHGLVWGACSTAVCVALALLGFMLVLSVSGSRGWGAWSGRGTSARWSC